MNDFAEFYAAHVKSLTIQLFAYTNDLPQAQDCVQEAFCRAVARWDRLATYDDPIAWVRRVAYNLATSRWRRNRTALTFIRRQREEYVDGPSPDRVALARALAELAPNHRKVVVLFYLAELSITEISLQEKIPAGTVKSWLHRGRTELAARLADTTEVRHA